MEGHCACAYNFLVPAVTEASFNCFTVVPFLSFISAWFVWVGRVRVYFFPCLFVPSVTYRGGFCVLFIFIIAIFSWHPLVNWFLSPGQPAKSYNFIDLEGCNPVLPEGWPFFLEEYELQKTSPAGNSKDRSRYMFLQLIFQVVSSEMTSYIKPVSLLPPVWHRPPQGP